MSRKHSSAFCLGMCLWFALLLFILLLYLFMAISEAIVVHNDTTTVFSTKWLSHQHCLGPHPVRWLLASPPPKNFTSCPQPSSPVDSPPLYISFLLIFLLKWLLYLANKALQMSRVIILCVICNASTLQLTIPVLILSLTWPSSPDP